MYKISRLGAADTAKLTCPMRGLPGRVLDNT